MVACPQCGGEIQSTRDWCPHCGFDPDGARPTGSPATPVPRASTVYTPPTFAPPTTPPGYGVPPPPGYTPPGYGQSGYPPPGPGYGPPGPGYGAPPGSPRRRSGGTTALAVLGGLGLAFVLLVIVCIGAVTLLGRNASSRFTSVDIQAGPVTEGWTTWTAPDGSFTIDMPGTPQVQALPVPDPVFASASSAQIADGNRLFAAQWLDLAPGMVMEDPQAGLDGAAQGLEQTGAITITGRQDEPFAGLPAARYTGAIVGSSVDVAGIYILTDYRIYSILATGNTPEKASAELEHMLSTFHIA